MELGISSYSFPWSIGVKDFTPEHPMNGLELLQYAHTKNIRHVQFGDNLPLHLLQEKELVDLKNAADELSVQIQVGTKRLTVENVQAYIAITNIAGADFIRMVIDDADYRPTENEVIKIIKDLLPQLEDAGVCLAIENHDRFSVKTLKHIIESTDPRWVAICLDTVNSLGAGEGINEVVACLAPYTINLHIKDFIIERVDHKMGFKVSGCVTGEGMLNIPWLIEELSKAGRCTTATLEVWSDPEKTIEATTCKEREWVEKSISYLKTKIT
jgi:sugar phosphate isomerase/epimerase